MMASGQQVRNDESEAPSSLPGTWRCSGNGGSDSSGSDYYFDNWRLRIYLKTNSVPSMNSMNLLLFI